MRLAVREEAAFWLPEYRYQVLQFCDRLPGTGKGSTLKNVLEASIVFRKEWHRYQSCFAPFDVCQSTGLCPDMVVEMTKYLWLDELINAFTTSILPLLRDGYSKIHLNNPTKRFVEMIPQHLDPRQVASLRITDHPLRSGSDFTAFRAFDQLISLTVISERASHRIEQCLDCLPNLRRLSLWLDNQPYSHFFPQLSNLSTYPITHLHIRCASTSLNDRWNKNQPLFMMKNTTITSFTFDLALYASAWSARCCSLNSPPFLSLALSFIESLVNVRRVRLIITSYEMGSISRVPRWQHILGECVHLNRVVVQLKSPGYFKQKARHIERELRQFRPEMIFRIETV